MTHSPQLLRAAVAGLVLMSAVGEGEVRVPDELLDPLLCAAVTFMFSAQKVSEMERGPCAADRQEARQSRLGFELK